MALSAAYALLSETTDCFSLLQVTMFPYAKEQYHVVDLRFVAQSAQFEFLYTSTPLFGFLLKYRPLPSVPFKVLKYPPNLFHVGI